MFNNLNPPSWLGYIGLVVSPLALLFGYLRYRTKTGIRIHGAYGSSSSIACDDTYVHSILLENQKDRAATIFAIYLRVGYNYFVEIQSFKHEPLILKAFETYYKEYDAIDFYSVNMRRIKMNVLLHDNKVPKRLFLSTSQGKYRVPRPYKSWDPVYDFFSNHSIAVIHAVRSTYKGKSYGSNVAYLVVLKFGDDAEQVIPIYSNDYEVRRFKNFRLTKESLESKQSLETFLNKQEAEGNLVAASIEVHDLKEWRDKLYEEKPETIEAKKLGRFQVHVMGRIFTYLTSQKMRRENKRVAQEQKRLSEKEHSAIENNEEKPPSPNQEDP